MGLEVEPPPASATLFTQHNADVRYDRESKRLLMVQGDVGANKIWWSLSDDSGYTWLPWDVNRTIAVHNVTACGQTCANHNPVRKRAHSDRPRTKH